MSPNPFAFLSATELTNRYQNGTATPLDVTRETIRDIRRLESHLNMFVVFNEDAAMRQAEESTKRWQKGMPLSALDGVPTSIKDLIATKDMPTQFGSKLTKGNQMGVDAPTVIRLKEAGAVILGKSTTSEFGCKAVGDCPLTGITRNPWNVDKTPGGSSCGAAAMVAAGVVPFAIGTDGGGSIRIPAALTGLFGIKANFGRVPVAPTSMTPTLAHVGPLARSVEDAALVLEVIAGFDGRDPFSIAQEPEKWSKNLRGDLKGLRVLFSQTFGYARPNQDVANAVTGLAGKLEEQGAIVTHREEIFPEDPFGLWASEFYAGVGTRLGPQLKDKKDLLDPGVAAFLEEAVQQEMGDYYKKVFERYELRAQMNELFNEYDILLSPTLPVSSLAAGENMPHGFEDRNMVSWAYYTYPFNLTGQPAASIPCGFDDEGMPIGAQMVAAQNREDLIFKVAAAVEKASPWSHTKPSLAFAD